MHRERTKPIWSINRHPLCGTQTELAGRAHASELGESSGMPDKKERASDQRVRADVTENAAYAFNVGNEKAQRSKVALLCGVEPAIDCRDCFYVGGTPAKSAT